MTQASNEEREQRILAVAADLFAYYGVDKTTISDIAHAAGISKGAIYLHFGSKDELLESVLVREFQQFAETWLATVEQDPGGGTIGGMYRNMLVALRESPFMMAIFKQDGRVLGNYLRKPSNFFQQQQFNGVRREFILMMQKAGQVRSELDPQVTAHIMNMLAFGLISMNDILDEKEIPPTEDIINGMADFMDRALTPAGGGDSETGKQIIRQLAADVLQEQETIATV